MILNNTRGCPRCRAEAYRVRRRLIDRILSLVRPQYRFRCSSMDCGWQGNLPATPQSAPYAAFHPSRDHTPLK